MNILTDSSYWQDTFIEYYQKESIDVSKLPVDLFKWYKIDNKPKLTCIVPDRDSYWYAILFLYLNGVGARFDDFKVYLLKYCIDSYMIMGKDCIHNLTIDRINWIRTLKETDIPKYEDIVSKIKDDIVSKLEEIPYCNKNTIEQFKQHVAASKSSNEYIHQIDSGPSSGNDSK